MKSKRINMHIVFFMWIIFICVIGFVSADFGGDVQVNDDVSGEAQMIGSEKTAVVLKDEMVYAVWQDWRNVSDNLQPDIYFSKGIIDSDGNVSFNENVMVNDVAHSPLNDKPSAPAMAVGDDGIIYVVWTDNRNIDNQLEGVDVYFSRSTNGGVSFEQNQLIGSTAGGSGAPAIASEGNYVYIVYEHCCDPANNVLNFVMSSNKGQSFNALETIYIPSEKENGAGQPTIAAENSKVYIAFQLKSKEYAGQVALMKSHDRGESFSDPMIINDDNEPNVQQASISLFVSDNNVYVTWHDFREPKGVYFSSSYDGGNSFSQNQLIVETGPNYPSPVIASYEENVTISYAGHSEGIYGWVLLAKISLDGGNTWGNASIVSDPDVDDPDIGPRSGIGPSSVSMNEKGVGILWVDGRGGWDNNIFFDWSGFRVDEDAVSDNDEQDDINANDTSDENGDTNDTGGNNDSEEENNKPSSGTPGFELVALMTAFAILVFMMRKRI